MGRKNCGKTILMVFLALVLAAACAACGGSSVETPVETTAPAVEYWACTGLDMGDGEMMDTESIRSLLGIDGSEVMALCIDGGKAELYILGDTLSCDWTETEAGGRLTSPEFDGVVAEFTAETDGRLKCVMNDENMCMTFLLSKVDTRPEIFDRPAQAETVSLPGFWVCTGLDMGDGEGMDAEAIQALFQTGADSVMSLRLREDGTAYVLYFGECICGTWEETDTGFDIRIGGEEGETLSFFDWGDGTVDLSVEDDNAALDFTLSKSDTTPEAFEKNALTLFDLSFTPEQALAMSNFMLEGGYVFSGEKLFGFSYYNTSDSILISCNFDRTRERENRLTEHTQIDMDGGPRFLQMANGYLYYICTNKDGSKLCRINPDGSGKTVLYDKDCSYLQICGDTMFFTDEKNRLVSADLDGQNVTVLIDKEVYFSYSLGEDWFLFQDDADGESLHIANLKYGFDQRLSEGRAFCYVLDGTYLYFVDIYDRENDQGHLTRMNLATMETEVSDKVMHSTVLIVGDRIYSESYGTYVEKDNWKNLEDGDWDFTGYRIRYIDEDTRICWYVNKDNYVEQYAIYAGDTFTTF